jgi:hypothetical protein
MRKGFLGFGVALALLCTLWAALPAGAQARLQRETFLAGVSVGSSFLDVLNGRGLPHYIGPALPTADEIENVLDPPPASLVDTAAAAVGGTPGMPGGAAMPGSPAAAPKPPREKYIVWMYAGDSPVANPASGWNMYVVFDKRGTVVSVVVSLKTPKSLPPGFSTTSGIRLGSKLFPLIDLYDWPEPFSQIGGQFFLSYPDKNVTFAVDKASRSVVTIAVGLPMTVVYEEAKADSSGLGGIGGRLSGPGSPVLPGSGGAVRP